MRRRVSIIVTSKIILLKAERLVYKNVMGDWGEYLCTAVAINRRTEALASVISFTFVVYSRYKHS